MHIIKLCLCPLYNSAHLHNTVVSKLDWHFGVPSASSWNSVFQLSGGEHEKKSFKSFGRLGLDLDSGAGSQMYLLFD